jgi:alpha-tubulin suppressor-like RCC1 family protein
LLCSMATKAGIEATLLAFGDLSHGQCAIKPGGNAYAVEPAVVEEAVNSGLLEKRVVRLTGGFDFFVALMSNGETWSWGRNKFGQLGMGDTADLHVPRPIEFMQTVTVGQVACGFAHTLFLSTAGDVYLCGSNSNGQLGLEEVTDDDNPAIKPGSAHFSAPLQSPIAELKSKTVAIAAGHYFSLFLLADGSLYSCGSSAYGQLGHGSNVGRKKPHRLSYFLSQSVQVKAIAAGYYHALALSTGNVLYAWGHSGDGRLGLGSHSGEVQLPREVRLTGSHEHETCEEAAEIVQLAAGRAHSAAVTKGGKLWIWGEGAAGQLGGGSSENAWEPRNCAELANYDVAQVFCGDKHTILLSKSGQCLGAGAGNFGQLGMGLTIARSLKFQLIPQLQSSFVATAAVAGRSTIVLAVTNEGDGWYDLTLPVVQARPPRSALQAGDEGAGDSESVQALRAELQELKGTVVTLKEELREAIQQSSPSPMAATATGLSPAQDGMASPENFAVLLQTVRQLQEEMSQLKSGQAAPVGMGIEPEEEIKKENEMKEAEMKEAEVSVVEEVGVQTALAADDIPEVFMEENQAEEDQQEEQGGQARALIEEIEIDAISAIPESSDSGVPPRYFTFSESGLSPSEHEIVDSAMQRHYVQLGNAVLRLAEQTAAERMRISRTVSSNPVTPEDILRSVGVDPYEFSASYVSFFEQSSQQPFMSPAVDSKAQQHWHASNGNEDSNNDDNEDHESGESVDFAQETAPEPPMTADQQNGVAEQESKSPSFPAEPKSESAEEKQQQQQEEEEVRNEPERNMTEDKATLKEAEPVEATAEAVEIAEKTTVMLEEHPHETSGMEEERESQKIEDQSTVEPVMEDTAVEPVPEPGSDLAVAVSTENNNVMDTQPVVEEESSAENDENTASSFAQAVPTEAVTESQDHPQDTGDAPVETFIEEAVLGMIDEVVGLAMVEDSNEPPAAETVEIVEAVETAETVDTEQNGDEDAGEVESSPTETAAVAEAESESESLVEESAQNIATAVVDALVENVLSEELDPTGKLAEEPNEVVTEDEPLVTTLDSAVQNLLSVYRHIE